MMTGSDISYISKKEGAAAELGVSIQQAEADLAALETREAALEAQLVGVQAELTSVRAEKERIKIYLELSQRYGSEETHVRSIAEPNRLNGAGTSLHVGLSEENEELIEACRGKSIPDAAIALIRHAGRPLSEEEIVERLRRGRVTLVSESPVVNVRFALLRKRKETGAVKQTDDKLWNVDDSCDGQERELIGSGFVQNRDRSEHAERSRQGLLAARERGVKNGARSKFTPEMKEKVEALLAEGLPGKEIARQVGVNIQTFHRWYAVGLVTPLRS